MKLESKIKLTTESIIVEGLWESPKALLAYAFSKKKPILLITAQSREDRLFENLSYFSNPIEFPAWETLPSEEIAPSPDIIGKRFEALYSLIHSDKNPIVLCPLPSLLQKIVPKKELQPLLLKWKKGDSVSFATLSEKLTTLGYVRSSVVSDKGQFALRGGILDIFPVSSQDPFRIDFFDDEIEEIRTFDPIGQKTIQKATEVFIAPANELDLIQSIKPLCSIADYLDDPIIFWDDLLAIEDAFVALKSLPKARSEYFYPLEELLKKWKKSQHIFCTKFHLNETFEMFGSTFHAKTYAHSFSKIDHIFPLENLHDPNLELLFLNSTQQEEEEVKKLLKDVTLPKNTYFEKGYLTSGFQIKNLAVIPNVELTHKSRIRRQKWRNTYHTPASDFHELSVGDLVVHFHSGIGRYLGLEKHTNNLGVETEFLILQYAEDSKLFVPLSQSHLVSRYIGAKQEAPVLTQLGSKRWQTTKAHATAQIVGYAQELLQMHAERVVHGGFRYPDDSDVFEQFEEDFPYDETPDQLAAIQSIKQDMLSEKPMDRLICGDVGYGKTEVAMRAAFKAVVDGKKQVAVLVPTTVLASQHYENFLERMKGFAVKIGLICRYQTAKQIKETLEYLRTGNLDIIVGTHRLLSADVEFKDLGLIIIDEEQRFGVKAKEHLKKFKISADCLTLSATPIPRTLYMSLVHARDMSVINTPPQDRLPIKSIIAETDLDLIQNALQREFARDGQAYFIHNRVESIASRATTISKLVPHAKIGIIHGQMDPEEIDYIIHQFKLGQINLLFATTIVENGIDIPNANTILIDRADTYGISDLYQLRGRVGRWNRAAYAYFLIPKRASLSEVAHKRLVALASSSGYGGGMKIAMRDLEIRGAGDFLGTQQSGQVSAIGFHLYCKLLKRAIDALKNQKPISFNETKLEFHFKAYLPEDYINEVSLRMELYYRLGEASNFQEVDELLSEMKDRFGKPQEPVIWLYHLTRIRVFATAFHFSLLKFSNISILAEQQLGKEIIKKTILLPKKVQQPKQLEEFVLKQLTDTFKLKVNNFTLSPPII